MAGRGGKGYFLTGSPGVGKSTIFREITRLLEGMGCRVGGISAPEVRASGRRIGFKIIDLMTGEEGWLAKAGYPSPVRIGRYGVVVDDVVRIGVTALSRAVREADVIGIDEIGPMELAVEELRRAIVEALESGKPVVGVVHRRLRSSDPALYRLVESLGPVVYVTLENRGELLRRAGEVAMELASGAGCSEGGQGTHTR